MAVGNIPHLNTALNRGLDAGLSVGEIKEILIQLYAYTGFPRSLNALSELMKVLDARKQRGIQDPGGARADPRSPEQRHAGPRNCEPDRSCWASLPGLRSTSSPPPSTTS
jgi:hypothetical protein